MGIELMLRSLVRLTTNRLLLLNSMKNKKTATGKERTTVGLIGKNYIQRDKKKGIVQ